MLMVCFKHEYKQWISQSGYSDILQQEQNQYPLSRHAAQSQFLIAAVNQGDKNGTYLSLDHIRYWGWSSCFISHSCDLERAEVCFQEKLCEHNIKAKFHKTQPGLSFFQNTRKCKRGNIPLLHSSFNSKVSVPKRA